MTAESDTLCAQQVVYYIQPHSLQTARLVKDVRIKARTTGPSDVEVSLGPLVCGGNLGARLQCMLEIGYYTIIIHHSLVAKQQLL